MNSRVIVVFLRENREIWSCDGAYRRTSVVDKERGVSATYLLCSRGALLCDFRIVCWLKEGLKKFGKYPSHHSCTKARKITGPQNVQNVPVPEWSASSCQKDLLPAIARIWTIPILDRLLTFTVAGQWDTLLCGWLALIYALSLNPVLWLEVYHTIIQLSTCGRGTKESHGQILSDTSYLRSYPTKKAFITQHPFLWFHI